MIVVENAKQPRHGAHWATAWAIIAARPWPAKSLGPLTEPILKRLLKLAHAGIEFLAGQLAVVVRVGFGHEAAIHLAALGGNLRRL